MLVLLAIVIGLAEGCPVPTRKQQERYPAPVVRAIRAADEVRRDLLAPLRPIGQLANVRQRWNLFRGASKVRYRMWIEGQVAGAWQLLYRAADDDHDLMAGELGYRRIRGAWNPRGMRVRGAWAGFGRWAAREIFVRRPDVARVRIRMEKVQIGPRGGWTPTGEFEHVVVRGREAPP